MTWPAFSGSSSAAEGTDEDGFRGGVEGDGPQEIPKDQQIRRFVRRRGVDLFLQSTFYTGLVLILLTFGYAQAVAECMSSSNRLKCFECNSHTDPYCGDPFNWTTLPVVKKCQGCCVKMVQGLGTPRVRIRRTCTSELKINMFMVDHVCMSESNRKGRLCFCEDDMCNKAARIEGPQSRSMLLAIAIAAMATAKAKL